MPEEMMQDQQQTMRMKSKFISVGANRIAGCSDWYQLESNIYEKEIPNNEFNLLLEENNKTFIPSEELTSKYKHLDLFAYGANRFISIYSPYLNKVLCTLRGHSEKVNSIQFMKIGAKQESNNVESLGLVSCGGNEIKIWKLNITKPSCTTSDSNSNKNIEITYEIIQTIKTKQINTRIAILKDYLIGSSDMEGNVSLYLKNIKKNSFELFKILKNKKQMEAISICELTNNENVVKDIIIACGCVDFNIYLYLLPNTIINNEEITTVETINRSNLILKGHEDWIRALTFKKFKDSFYLASGSQDNRIRIWKINLMSTIEVENIKKEKEELANINDELLNIYNTFYMPSSIDSLNITYQITLDTILTGHEDWIHSLHWHPFQLKLLSSSMDRTLMIWSPLKQMKGVWNNEYRMGEFGGLSGLFGQMGYFNGNFSMFGNFCMSTSFHGSFHLWKFNGNEWKPKVSITGHVQPVMDLDLEPSPNGVYFLTTSLDQTTRCWTCIDVINNREEKKKKNEQEEGMNGKKEEEYNFESEELFSIKEIARTQIHGYDLNCLSFYDYYSYISGADEKVVRIFDAPQSFLNNLGQLNSTLGKDHVLKYGGGVNGSVNDNNGMVVGKEEEEGKSVTTVGKKERVMAATVPALGLTNKSIREGEEREMITTHEFEYQQEEEEEESIDDALAQLNNTSSSMYLNNSNNENIYPPFETQLLQFTLWPEYLKLYGHVNELYCTSVNFNREILATSCKAKNPSLAQIKLWNIKNDFKLIDSLPGHHLTVSRIQFSNNDEWMCSVSKDRCMILYRKKLLLESDNNSSKSSYSYVPLLYQNQCHERIIWDVSFTFDDKFIATGSRDHFIKIFKVPGLDERFEKHEQQLECIQSIDMKQPVTSIHFVSLQLVKEFKEYFNESVELNYLLAVGLEDGSIYLFKGVKNDSNDSTVITWKCICELNKNECHDAAIRRFKFRMNSLNGGNQSLELLSCSLDHSVRCFDIFQQQ